LAVQTSGATPSGDAAIVDETGAGRYQVEAKVGSSSILIDEPVSVGGLGSGPNPYGLLSAALGSCTLMTMRLYAERKGWPLARARVKVTHHRSGLEARDVFSRDIALEGDLDDDQRTRLIEIAQRCPVHLTLERGADVTTTLLPMTLPLGDATAAMGEHLLNMQEACDR
jgi:putative redox protein